MAPLLRTRLPYRMIVGAALGSIMPAIITVPSRR